MFCILVLSTIQTVANEWSKHTDQLLYNVQWIIQNDNSENELCLTLNEQCLEHTIYIFLFLENQSFSSKLISKPRWSVLYPTTLSFSLTNVFTDLVNWTSCGAASIWLNISRLKGTVTFTPFISSFLICSTIFFRSPFSTFFFS